MFVESRRGYTTGYSGLPVIWPGAAWPASLAAFAAIEPDSPTVAQVTATAAARINARPAPREPEAELLLREINLISPHGENRFPGHRVFVRCDLEDICQGNVGGAPLIGYRQTDVTPIPKATQLMRTSPDIPSLSHLNRSLYAYSGNHLNVNGMKSGPYSNTFTASALISIRTADRG
jgi:hypothetical protein